MKKLTTILGIVLMVGVLTGCGHVKSVKELYAYAKDTYGSSTMIDKETHGKILKTAYTTIVCQDDEYGFTYTVSDYMRGVGLDGATFYHKPYTKSDFEITYTVALYDQIKDKIPAIEQKYNVIYEPKYSEEDLTGYDQWITITFWGYVRAYDSTSAGKAAVEIAKLYSEADTRGYFTSPDRHKYEYPEIRGLKMDAVIRMTLLARFPSRILSGKV